MLRPRHVKNLIDPRRHSLAALWQGAGWLQENFGPARWRGHFFAAQESAISDQESASRFLTPDA
jgi:hypothetical protein